MAGIAFKGHCDLVSIMVPQTENQKDLFVPLKDRAIEG